MRNRTLLRVTALIILLSAAGCGTIKGVGDDISTVGGWLSRGSEKVQNR